MEAREHALPGDRESLGELLAGLEPRLQAVALRFTRDPESARDVVQSAFEQVVRHRARFEGRSRASTWIHRIVANEALMWLRAERRRSALRRDAETLPAEPGPGPAETLDDRRRQSRLSDAIARLPAAERDVLMRCTLGGLSYAEYGARTGAHPGAVKTRAFRARRRLGRWVDA